MPECLVPECPLAECPLPECPLAEYVTTHGPDELHGDNFTGGGWCGQSSRPGDAVKLKVPDVAIGAALALSTFAVYARVSGFGFLNFDDELYVTQNAHVTAGLTTEGAKWAFTGVVAGNWMPVTLLSHMLDVQLFGMRSGMHHLVNVLLHALAAVLLFGCLRRATGERGPSAFVAFVFALHPLHVSSVAWVAERKDVLSACFWFLALYCYVRYAERPSAGRYLPVAAFFSLGLMSKPMLVTFPFTLLLLDLWPLRRLRWPGAIVEKLPLVALSAAASAVTYFAQLSGGAVQSTGLLMRAENAVLSYAIYLGQTFWPVRLAVMYPYPQSIRAAEAAAALALVLLFSGVAAGAWRTRPWVTIGWFWYLGTLVPVIGFIQAGEQAHADRYMYIPMIGLSIVLAWSAQEAALRWPAMQRPFVLAGVMACFACAARARAESAWWHDSETLFRRALAVTQRNAVAHNNLGAAMISRGGYVEAIPQLEAALRIRPDHAEANYNLGIARMLAGDSAAAIAHFETAIRVRPNYA